MAVDIKKLLDIVQKRINNLDSSTVTLQELIDIANFTDKASNGTIQFVDDSSDLPNLENPDLPTAEGNRNLTFVKNSGRLFAKKEKWKPFTFRGLIPTPAYSFQGSTSGYTSGGQFGSNVVDKFPFASDGNATDVGDLTVGRYAVAGQSSTASGYTSGGLVAPTNSASDVIDKFPFSSDANATDVGNLTAATWNIAGQSSGDNGYISGGNPYDTPTILNIIEKFPFSSDGNATDVGDMTVARYEAVGQSSTDNGYTSGGNNPPTGRLNVIDKFPFSSDGNATDVGDLTVARSRSSGQSSADHGYMSGGIDPTLSPTSSDVIDKFPFSSDANATDVGNLTSTNFDIAGQSSTANGYSTGAGGGGGNKIEKFSFSSDGNATDVGDLSTPSNRSAGQQV